MLLLLPLLSPFLLFLLSPFLLLLLWFFLLCASASLREIPFRTSLALDGFKVSEKSYEFVRQGCFEFECRPGDRMGKLQFRRVEKRPRQGWFFQFSEAQLCRSAIR